MYVVAQPGEPSGCGETTDATPDHDDATAIHALGLVDDIPAGTGRLHLVRMQSGQEGQIAWVSGRNGLPQIYMMDADGSNVQQVTTEGYAVSPSWSPNGRLLTFAWIRHYGPGAPGGQDIYLMDVASRQFVQLTHDSGRNDFPSWSPDGRHIVFQSTRSGSEQIWTMLADGTHQQQLTREGKNSQPNWSFK